MVVRDFVKNQVMWQVVLWKTHLFTISFVKSLFWIGVPSPHHPCFVKTRAAIRRKPVGAYLIRKLAGFVMTQMYDILLKQLDSRRLGTAFVTSNCLAWMMCFVKNVSITKLPSQQRCYHKKDSLTENKFSFAPHLLYPSTLPPPIVLARCFMAPKKARSSWRGGRCEGKRGKERRTNLGCPWFLEVAMDAGIWGFDVYFFDFLRLLLTCFFNRIQSDFTLYTWLRSERVRQPGTTVDDVLTTALSKQDWSNAVNKKSSLLNHQSSRTRLLNSTSG